MAVYQLLGRGTYGPRVQTGPGISPLWQFFLSPPAQNSILIYQDGTVVEQQTFENEDIKSPDVFLYILGGTDFRATDDSFAYQALTDAGYTWRLVPDQNTYSAEYIDNYNREWEQANTRIVEDRKEAADTAAAAYARAQRIAALQAEIAALEAQG